VTWQFVVFLPQTEYRSELLQVAEVARGRISPVQRSGCRLFQVCS
jgi:hypothetical protein